MLRQPRFKAHLTVEVPTPDRLVIRSEGSEAALPGRLFPLLAPYLDGRHTVQSISDRLVGQATILDVQLGVSALEEQGYLIEGAEPIDAELAVFRDAYGVPPENFRDRLASTALDVTALAPLEADPLISRLRSLGLQVAPAGAVTPNSPRVVLSADPLDPALDRIDQQSRELRSPWLLIRPTATSIWLGPLFQPGETGCWRCLARRLEANRSFDGHSAPAEDRQTAAACPTLSVPTPTVPTPSVPTPAVPATPQPILELAWHLATIQVLKWLVDGAPAELVGGLIVFDPSTLISTPHRLIAAPYCPRCGPQPPIPEQPPPPIRLRSRPLGHGLSSVEEIYQRLAHHVSPVTGLVGAVQPLPGTGDGAANGQARVFLADHVFGSVAAPGSPTSSYRRQMACGKGLSSAQARASALCEALERVSGVFRGYEPRISACRRDLGEAGLHPNECMGFSDAQYQERDRWNALGIPSARVPEPFDDRQVIDWSPVWSLTHQRPRFLPSAYCYYESGPDQGRRFCAADSNGCAAGATLEEAILQGFFELLERDAVALWWAHQVQRPRVALESFDRAPIEALVARYRSLARELQVLDITHDFGVPTIAAVSWDPSADRPLPVVGFGTHFKVEIAVLRALTELDQTLLCSELNPQIRILSEPLESYEFLRPRNTAARRRDDFPQPPTADPAHAVLRCVELAAARGLETLVLDQTRPEIGLPAVRVVVPGLRHFWPRFAPGRLYSVPVELGWIDQPRTEEELNPVHLLI